MNKLSSRFTPINDDDNSCERTDATFAIYNVDPELLTSELGLVPTYMEKVGVLHTLPSGVERAGTLNSWLFSSEKNDIFSKDIRTHLNFILDKLELRLSALVKIQQMSGVKMAIRCVWWSKSGDGGPTIWPEQMKRMAKLNLELTISFAYYGKK